MQKSTSYHDLLDLARQHFVDGQYTQAESLLQQILLKNNKIAEVFHMLASIYYDQGKFNKAIKAFKRALEIDPEFTDASVGLSILLNDLGRYQEGQEVFKNAQKQLEKRKKGEKDPRVQEKFATKHCELAALYTQYNRHEEALEQYKTALNLSQRRPEISMKVVDCLVHLNRQTDAMKILKTLIKEYPQYHQARNKLGILCFNSGRVTEAVEQWEGVLMRDSENPEAKTYLRSAQEAGMTSI